jgi:hypothetical protein
MVDLVVHAGYQRGAEKDSRHPFSERVPNAFIRQISVSSSLPFILFGALVGSVWPYWALFFTHTLFSAKFVGFMIKMKK